MAFDNDTRNKLAKMVGDARSLLREELTHQFQEIYGIQPDGTITDLDQMTHLDGEQRDAARVMRERIDYLAIGMKAEKQPIQPAVHRMIREQSFTVLNRFAALRMCEERGLIQPCVSGGMDARGFHVYLRVAGTALGDQYDRYRAFIFSVFDEIAVDLGILFDRYSHLGLLFPRENALIQLLEIINRKDLAHIWAEDEAIGWIYQYFNSPEERRAMRRASTAPRNSRELAVRNQFFTPRYVVAFLTDNTLGRTWYEMRQGVTVLKDRCQYLVRRPDEVFFTRPSSPTRRGQDLDPAMRMLMEGTERSFPPFSNTDADIDRIIALAHTVNGYARHPVEDTVDGQWWPKWKLTEIQQRGSFDGTSTQDLLDILFAEARAGRHGDGDGESFRSQPVFIEIANEIRRRALASRREDRSQEELLNDPVFIPSRPLKDPRDIKMLDPACGSMHFGLYAFDLYECIYDEAWEIEESHGATAFERNEGLTPLHEIYASKDAFQRDVPRLIIEHNIHGIDIDPRAVQIAALALWLRAQRSWNHLGIKAVDRPRIRKSNVVTAEPMPGDESMRREFIDGLKPKVLGQLVDVVFQKMTLAGEAGSLLKIEEEIKDAVAEARKQWREGPKPEQQELFGFEKSKPLEQKGIRFDVKDVTDEGFWAQAEDRILDALSDYAERAENGQTIRRRMFSEDAGRGFAFIDLCRKRYDVALMNPPFGEFINKNTSYMEENYTNWSKNLLCASIIRSLHKIKSFGFLGVIFDRTASIKSSYKKFRKDYLDSRIVKVADTGWYVLDANVETTVHVLMKKEQVGYAEFIDLRECEPNSKDYKLKSEIVALQAGRLKSNSYLVSPLSFQKLPNAIVGYYFNDTLLNIFRKNKNLKECNFQARQGHALVSDIHFRLFWELPFNANIGKGKQFSLLYNGSDFSLFTAPHRDMTIFGKNGDFVVNNKSVVLRNGQYQFQSGVGYGKRGEIIDAHLLCAETIFTSEGQAITNISNDDAYFALSFLNSSLAQYVINQYCGQHKHCGYVNLLPIPSLKETKKIEVIKNAMSIVNLKKHCFEMDETALEFSLLFVDIKSKPKGKNGSMKSSIISQCQKIEKDTFEIRNKILKNDNLFKKAADLNADASDIIDTYINSKRPLDYPWPDMERDRSSESVLIFLLKSILSQLIGCIFGRWDTRFFDKPHLLPHLSDPFQPMIACPNAMLISPDGIPAKPNQIVSEEWLRARLDANTLPPEGSVQNPTIPDSEYPLRITWGGILVNDTMEAQGPTHPDDIICRIREVLDLLWGDGAHEIEQEACDILNVKTLREYFTRPTGFFADHLKRYSKSRRKAPIYWPLSTASNGYTLWIYYHRLTDQTLYMCVKDFVEPKIKAVSSDIEQLEKKLAQRNSTKLRNQRDALSDFHDELKDFKDELDRVAKLPYRPNLNDGVLITAAPLWRLFRHTPWRGDLEACWEKLEAGDYDWAHLAYSIWPERVEDKCRSDRSLAIAHGLESICEVKEKVKKTRKTRKRKASTA